MSNDIIRNSALTLGAILMYYWMWRLRTPSANMKYFIIVGIGAVMGYSVFAVPLLPEPIATLMLLMSILGCVLVVVYGYKYWKSRTIDERWRLELPRAKHSLTLRNSISKEVMVIINPWGDSDTDGLRVLTVMGKEQTKTIGNAVFIGQSFTILAKDVAGSGSKAILFTHKFTEEEIKKLNWTVVIGSNYDIMKKPDCYQQPPDILNRKNW